MAIIKLNTVKPNVVKLNVAKPNSVEVNMVIIPNKNYEPEEVCENKVNDNDVSSAL